VSHFYNSWKTFSLLYRPSTVNPVCRDEATAVSPAPTTTHMVNPPVDADVYHVGYPLQRSCAHANRTNKSTRMSLIF